MHIIVAGAGIVGVSTAIWLQRAGHDVTLIDRQAPGQGTSYGNGGVLASVGLIPVPVPGILRKAPRMLFDPNQPLFLRWSYLPRLLPFLARYLSHARMNRVESYAAAMSHILVDSYEQHRALSEGTPAARFLHGGDYVYGYPTRAAFEAEAKYWKIRRDMGIEYDVLDADTYARRDPLYDGQFECIVACRNHGRISDPGAYVAALADHFQEQGGTFARREITDVTLKDGACTGIVTDQGEMRADRHVLCLGPWSGHIARKLGLRDLSFESERGYHLEFVNPSVMPRDPLMMAAGKFVITPMEGRIRAAGIVEFGGLRAGPSEAPFALLERQVKDLLPGLTYDRIDRWMGHRPAPSDSLPLIGAAGAGDTTFVAFGHQHVGLTGGPKTGRILARMIGGQRENFDLTPFDPTRYA